MTSKVVLGFLCLTVLLPAAPAHAQQSQESTNANYETRLSTIEDQMRALNGRVEQLEFAIRRFDTTMQRMQQDLDARMQRLEQAPPQTQGSIEAPTPPVASNNMTSQGTPEVANGTLGALKLQNGRVTGGAVNPQAPPLPETPPDYGLSSQEQYDYAFGLLRQANYDGAEKAFKSFIEKNPKDKLIDNAKYWYGETLYVRGRFNDSAVAFADAFQQNPHGVKAPDSLLKLAMSLAAIDKTEDACTSLGELKSNFPSASSTVRSRAVEESAKLHCKA